MTVEEDNRKYVFYAQEKNGQRSLLSGLEVKKDKKKW